MFRARNRTKALRQSTVDSAVFNVLCHYPVEFVKSRKRKAHEALTATPQEWGVVAFKKIKNDEGDDEVLCVPQLSCEDAFQRWNVVQPETAEPEITPDTDNFDDIYDDDIT